MKIFRLISAYRWPIYVGGHLVMSVTACGVLVWVATRPDTPRPIPNYYEDAQAWDANEAVEEASRSLGWTAAFELPADIPHVPGMPRPVDIRVHDRQGRPVSGLAGQLLALRGADAQSTRRGQLVELPQQPGSYRTLVQLDQPGTWDLRMDAAQQRMRLVLDGRITVSAPDASGTVGERK